MVTDSLQIMISVLILAHRHVLPDMLNNPFFIFFFNFLVTIFIEYSFQGINNIKKRERGVLIFNHGNIVLAHPSGHLTLYNALNELLYI